MTNDELVQKYNVAVPRYTSYPPVPGWNTKLFSAKEYLSALPLTQLKKISLYIHLPYCESLCTYCGCNTRITVNHQVEEPYIDALLNEFKLYLEVLGYTPLIEELHLGGGTPTFFSASNLSKLITGLKNLAPFNPEGDFSFEGHPNNTTFGHLKVLRDLGFNRVSFGVQDFDQKVQTAINRIQPFENVKRVVEWSRFFNYTSINLDLVYGLPFQTLESIKKTIEHVIELKPDRIAFYSYAHVPWMKPGQRKFTEDDLPSDSYKKALFEFGKTKFIENGYALIGFDHFALPQDKLNIAFLNGCLHRNFMGYTTARTTELIGLGVSSISETSIGYAQNEKTIETYLDSIKNKNIPLIKGHILNKTEIQTKKVISNLMCNLKCDLKELDKIGTEENISQAIHDLSEDNLIEIHNHCIVITETGRDYIRNICAAFDPELKSENQISTYSKAI